MTTKWVVPESVVQGTFTVLTIAGEEDGEGAWALSRDCEFVAGLEKEGHECMMARLLKLIM